MRALAIHGDAIVLISGIWQTTCTAVRGGEEGFLIDSPVLPEEIEALPGVLEQSGFPVSGLLCTHADWDHLLGRSAFGQTALGVGEPSAVRLAADPGGAQRALRAFDEEHYLTGRPPLALGALQELPVPGKLDLGHGADIELHPAPGHTADGTAFWMPWLGILVCGDYLSPVEIPMISAGGSLDEYRATLDRLEALLARAGTVVPGHGGPLPAQEARRVLGEDRCYLTDLEQLGVRARLPPGRDTAEQRRIHEANLARVTSGD
ncbi:MAG: MBL fold metallo-hydrolase [Solirubrobacteraceae bacterium]